MARKSSFLDYSSTILPVLVVAIASSICWTCSSRKSLFCLSLRVSAFAAYNSLLLSFNSFWCFSLSSETNRIYFWSSPMFCRNCWCCSSMNSISLFDCLVMLSWMSWYLMRISFSRKYLRSRFSFLCVVLSSSTSSSSRASFTYNSSFCSQSQYFSSSMKKRLLFSRKSLRLTKRSSSFLFFVISPLSSLLRR